MLNIDLNLKWKKMQSINNKNDNETVPSNQYVS